MRRWLSARREAPGGTATALVGAVLGDLEGPVGVIDEKGRVDVGPGDWRIEWGVGAEDRWHVAHDEVAVRQQRVDDAPVYATWMRVPGGDVVQRTAVVNDGVGRAVLLEYENASPAAVVVAVAVRRPAGGAIDADPDAVSIDGEEWLRTERPAGGLLIGSGDLWDAIEAGPDSAPQQAAIGADGAALLVALPHRQTVRFLALVHGAMPSRWPTPADVASGWRAVTDGALAIELPDADLGEAWRRIVPDLVVQAGSHDPRLAAEAAPPLDTAGLAGEADRARATVVDAAMRGAMVGGDAVAALRALASRDIVAAMGSGLDELAGPLAEVAGSALDADTLMQVARALEPHAGAAAADARRLAPDATAPAFEPVSAPAVAAATVLDRVLAQTRDGRLVLLPDVDEGWWGAPVDVRGLITAHGALSFSVRWHGERPALLWERVGGPDGVDLACGLDPGWSSGERRGEALLAAPGA